MIQAASPLRAIQAIPSCRGRRPATADGGHAGGRAGAQRQVHDLLLVDLLAGELAHDVAVAAHEHAVRQPGHLGQVARREHHRHPVGGERPHEAVDLGLGADVDAARRLVEQQHARARAQPLREHDLLLVAARELPRALVRARGADGQPLALLLERRALARGRQPAARRDRGEVGERRVGPHREQEHEALGLALLGHEDEPGADRVAHRRADRAVAYAHLAGRAAVHAGERAQQPAAARAEQAGDRDDLALADLEVEALSPAPARRHHPARPQREGLAVRRRLREDGVDVAPDHLAHQARDVVLAARPARDQPAVAQHADLVGQHGDLLQAMADVEHRDALLRQGAHRVEDRLQLLAREHRGRLVEDQHARLAHERARDLHQLLVGQREALGRRVEVELAEPDPRQRGGGQAPLLGAVQPPAPAALLAEHHVVDHRHRGQHRQLLEDRGHAAGEGLPRIGEAHRAPVDQDLPRVRLHVPGEQPHERRLAGAVLAHEGVHAAGAADEVDAVERAHARERLAQAPGLQHRVCRSRRHLSRA